MILVIACLQERDPTLFVASAWNDNGFIGISNELAALRRTSYFPGLGWLLPRKLFDDEVCARVVFAFGILFII